MKTDLNVIYTTPSASRLFDIPGSYSLLYICDLLLLVLSSCVVVESVLDFEIRKSHITKCSIDMEDCGRNSNIIVARVKEPGALSSLFDSHGNFRYKSLHVVN